MGSDKAFRGDPPTLLISVLSDLNYLGLIMNTKFKVTQFSFTIFLSCVSVFCQSDPFSKGLVGHYQSEDGGYFDIDLMDDKGEVGFRVADFTEGGKADSNTTSQCVTFFEMQIIVPHDLSVGNSVVCNHGSATVVGFIADFKRGDGRVNKIYQIQVESKHDLRTTPPEEDIPKYQLYYSPNLGLLALSYPRWGDIIFYKRKMK